MKNERAEMEKVVQYLRGRIAVLEGLVLLPASIRELSEAMKTRDLEQRQLMTQGFQSIVTAVQARPLLGEQDHPRRVASQLLSRRDLRCDRHVNGP